MTRCKASFPSRLCFGICLALLPCGIEAILKDACPEDARIMLSPKESRDKPLPVSMRNVTLDFDGFPQDLKWIANGSTYGCICDVFTCLRLCCPRGSVVRDNICVSIDGAFVDQWPDVYFENLTLKPSNDFFPIVQYPCGQSGAYSLDVSAPADSMDGFHLLDDAFSIRLGVDGSVTDEYCLDPESTQYGPAMCYPRNAEADPPELRRILSVVASLVSIPCLLVTFVVYVLLPELNTIHGLTLRCYVASLGVSLIFLVAERITRLDQCLWLCQFIALGIYFSFMASFAWLNIMCMDIWRTFGSRNPTFVVDGKEKRRKFMFYSIYAWGIAFIFSGICVIMEIVPGLSEDFLRPDILSSTRCWFATWEAELVYYYGPITVSVICNIFMFLGTAMKMMWHQRTVAPQLDNDHSRLHHDAKKWLTLYFKLFIVMGINWITEVIAWWWQVESFLWNITDIVNALQGFIIFLILVCKRQIIRSLKKRFKEIRCPRKDNELHSHSSSMNISQRTRSNTSNCRTMDFQDTSTSESTFSSNADKCLSCLENTIEVKEHQ